MRMGFIDSLEDEDYWPEFGTVVIRDKGDQRFEGERDGDADIFLLSELAGPLFGTVARAGNGWLQLTATDSRQHVRIETHDTMPLVESGPWLDIMETPYRSFSGMVAFATMTSGPYWSNLGLSLGQGPGLYRARVYRADGEDGGNLWLVRFWPERQIELPRWLRREPGSDGETSATGYRAEGLGEDIFSMVSWTPHGQLSTTVTQLAVNILADTDAILAVLRDPESAYLRLQGIPDQNSLLEIAVFTDDDPR